jgi:type I site-specific restriction endonuclease
MFRLFFASNGDGFIFHDKTNPQQLESEITLSDFPTPEQLWQKYCVWKGYSQEQLPVISGTTTMTAAENLPVTIRCRQLTEH